MTYCENGCTCNYCMKETFETNNVQWRAALEKCPAGTVSPINEGDFTFNDFEYPCCPADMLIYHHGENKSGYCDNK